MDLNFPVWADNILAVPFVAVVFALVDAGETPLLLSGYLTRRAEKRRLEPTASRVTWHKP